MKLSRRPRRLRDLKTAKSMVRECELNKEDLILPVFVSDHCKSKEKIESIWPGAFTLEFVEQNNLLRVGRHSKFKHIVDK